MTKHDVALVVPFLAVALAGASTHAGQTVLPQPPMATKRPHTTEIHGYTLKDDYFWLREKSNPEVIKYLESENAYTEEVMKPTKALQETLYTRDARPHQADRSQRAVADRRVLLLLADRGREAVSLPLPAQGQHGRRRRDPARPQRAGRRPQVPRPRRVHVVSDDGNWLAYSTDTTGYRQYTLHVKDLRTGKVLAENIERVGLGRLGDRQPDALLHDRRRGLEAVRQVLAACGRRGRRATCSTRRRASSSTSRPRRSLDKKVIFLASYAKTSTEVRYLPADAPAAAPKVVLPREAGHEYDVDHYNGLFYITTNKGAKNFKVVTAPMNDPAEKNWQVFIDHNPAVKINGLAFFANHIVVSEREGGLTRAPRDRPEDQAVAPHRHRRAGLRAVARRQPRVRDDDAALQLSVDGHAVVGLRLRHDDAQADAAQAAGSARRLRPVALRGEARLGRRARRHEGAGLARAQEGHRARRQGAAAALRLRLVRRVGSADVLLESPEPARPRRDLRHRLHPRRRRDGRGVARAGPHDEEDEHLHRLHRLRRAPRQEPLHRPPIGW